MDSAPVVTSVNNTPTGQIVVKSKVVQITIVAVVAITLLTTGIVYANDDLMTEIENAIKSLQQVDKQQDKQIKKLTKQVKELQQQNEELQQENENQTKKIKRLKEFRDNAWAEIDQIYESIHIVNSDLQNMKTQTVMEGDDTTPPSQEQTMMEGDDTPDPPPEPLQKIITLNKTTVTRGDSLELIVNIESIPSTMIVNATINDTRQETNATLNSLEVSFQHIDGMGVSFMCSINNTGIEGCPDDYGYDITSEIINQTAFTLKILIPYNWKIGSYEMWMPVIYSGYEYKEYGVKKDGDNWEIISDDAYKTYVAGYQFWYKVIP